jgi:hypothetical protein
MLVEVVRLCPPVSEEVLVTVAVDPDAEPDAEAEPLAVLLALEADADDEEPETHNEPVLKDEGGAVELLLLLVDVHPCAKC